MGNEIEKAISAKIAELKTQGCNANTFAFSYARVSSEKQEKGNSRDDQVLEATEYANNHEFHLIHTFESTESAWHNNREVFNRMLELALEHKVKNLIFKNYDRLSRNYLDWGRVIDLIKYQGLQIHFYEQAIILHEGSTAEEFLMGNFGAMMANYWSNKISQSVKRACKNKAEKKGVALKAPFGYKWDDTIKNFVFHPVEAPIIKEMFDLYDSQQYSMMEVARILNAKGYKTQKGYKFNAQTITRILRNEFYAGIYRFKGMRYKGSHPTFVSEERLADRIKFIEDNFKGHRKQSTDFLLSKFVKCSICGKMYTGYKIKNSYIYYDHKCAANNNQKGRIRETELMGLIDKEVEQAVYFGQFDDYLKRVFKNSISSRVQNTKKRKKDLNRSIAQNETKKERLLDLYGDGQIKKEDLYKKINEVEIDIGRLKDELEILDDDLGKYEYKVIEVIDYLRYFSDTYAKDSNEGRIELLRTMASGIYFDGMFKVRIDWIKPFSFLLDPKVMAQVNNLPENNKRREIPPPEKFKSRSAGEMGLKLLDNTMIFVLLWFRKYT